jgi:hypothetical protein
MTLLNLTSPHLTLLNLTCIVESLIASVYVTFVLDVGADLFLHIHFVPEEKQLFSKVEIKQNQAMNKKDN